MEDPNLNNKTVSVLMPVYNSAKYLNEAIDSILNQTYRNFDFVIINDGSQDNSKEIIQSYKDERIKYYENNENQGLIFTLNKGFNLIESEYIIRMDADDISHPDRIFILVKYMNLFSNLVLIGSAKQDIDHKFINVKNAKIEIIESKIINAIAIFNNPFVHPSIIIRNSFIKSFNIKYDDNYCHSEDNALWLDILLLGDTAILNIPLLNYRKHSNQVSELYKEIQITNSMSKRKDFVELLLNKKITKVEYEIIKAISFKEMVTNVNIFNELSAFKKNVITPLNYNIILPIDKHKLDDVFYKRTSLLYLKNSHLGLRLYFNYIYHFLFSSKLNIGFKLLFKTLYYGFK